MWSSGNPTCSCSSCTSTLNLTQGNFFYYHTGDCASPYLNSISVQATDASTAFRVWTKTSQDVNPATSYYPLGSSTSLDGSAMSCFTSTFVAGTATALVSQTSARDLYVVVKCESATCNIMYNIDIGCSVATTATEAVGTLDSCMQRCGNFGNCVSGSCTSCTNGFTGAYCNLPPANLPVASGSGSALVTSSTGSSNMQPTGDSCKCSAYSAVVGYAPNSGCLTSCTTLCSSSFAAFASASSTSSLCVTSTSNGGSTSTSTPTTGTLSMYSDASCFSPMSSFTFTTNQCQTLSARGATASIQVSTNHIACAEVKDFPPLQLSETNAYAWYRSERFSFVCVYVIPS